MNHLAYYRAQGISPVQYGGTREQHFDRRASLYRSLRLPPLAFRGSTVLEVASGTGQNAEYLASLNPKHLELIEPYPARWSSQSAVKIMALEHYVAPYAFDVVICENWLGLPEVESGLLDKLASVVAPQGVLVLTCVHPQGIYPNLLRRQIAQRLINNSMTFEEKTALLVHAFGPHLETLKDMTRSHRDWVQDMLLNPAVEHIGLTFPMLIEKLGKDFTILGTSPEFIRDGRWFKTLHGDQRNFNARALWRYEESIALFQGYGILDNPLAARKEGEEMLKRAHFTADEVRNMGDFRKYFGAETLYASWQRN